MKFLNHIDSLLSKCAHELVSIDCRERVVALNAISSLPVEDGWSDDGVSDARSPEDRPQLAQETRDGQFQRRDHKQQADGERRLGLPAHHGQ